MKKIIKLTAFFLGISILLIVFIRLFFPIYRIASDSMKPTMNKGDYILVSRFHYEFFEPNRNDIVLFEPINEIFKLGPWSHRIIAIEGDSVSIKNNVIFINEKKALFPIVNHKDLDTTVPESFIFQKGDNAETIIGLVPKDKIVGKVIFSF